MATRDPTPHPDDVVLIVPVGARRTGRIMIPPETTCWLRDQLIVAVGAPESEQKPRRPVRLRRGRWRA